MIAPSRTPLVADDVATVQVAAVASEVDGGPTTLKVLC